MSDEVRVNFIFPARRAGGVQSFLANACAELSRRGAHYRLFDYSWGHVSTRLHERGARVPELVLLDGRRSLGGLFTERDVVFGTNEHLYTFPSYLRGAPARALFWDVNSTFWRKFLRLKVKRFSHDFAAQRLAIERRLVEAGALTFIDRQAVDAFEEDSGLRVERPAYLPMCVPVPERPSERPALRDGVARVTYVGRPEGWKVHTATRALRDFLEAGGDRVRATVVTTDAERFRALMGDESVASRVHFQTGLFGDKLDAFLRDETDLLVAMGTASLEGAKLGVPCVLVDYTLGEIPADYRHRWFSRARENDLGTDVARREYAHGAPASELLAELRDDPGSLGRACWERARARFSVGSSVDALLGAARASSMYVRELEPFWALRLLLARIRLARGREFESVRFRSH